MEALELIEAPAPIVDGAEVKAFLRLSDADTAVINDDALIGSLMDAATSFLDGADGYLGRALGRQRWRLTLDAFPRDAIEVPLPPLHSVTTITYRDSGGTTRTLGASEFRVLIPGAAPGIIRPTGAWGFPATARDGGAVQIEFTAGYETVPAPIRTAILQHVALLYENREMAAGGSALTAVPFAGLALVEPYRRLVF